MHAAPGLPTLAPDRCLMLPAGVLDRLMPMYLHLSGDGTILAHGPTLGKIFGPERLTGHRFLDLFDVRSPAGMGSTADLFARQGQRLHLCLRGRTDVGLRGLALADAAAGLVLNLSFGIGLVDAVRQHALTDADFAPTDLAVEMLYLVEAKHAVLEEFQRLNRALQGAKVAAEEQALTDTLTGLRNRRALDAALAAACAGRRAFALMHLDLDYFKAVNDSLGHAAGDHVLRHVARVLTREMRAGDTVARVGGDEFVILLAGVTDPDHLSQVAERIIAGLSQPIAYEGEVCRIGASVGMTLSTTYPSCEAEQMSQDADHALYAAKRAGRARAVVFSAHD